MNIKEEDALRYAKETAEKNGWAWVEPVEVTWHPSWIGKNGKWAIITNANGLGAKIRMIIDNKGRILEKGYVPR